MPPDFDAKATRFQAALDTFVARLQDDRYALAAVLSGIATPRASSPAARRGA